MPKPDQLRALMVYGHRPTADMLGQLFAMCGQEVVVAYDGAVACELARQMRADLVLLDLRTRGREVAQQLRAQPELQHTALVAITEPGGEEAAFHSAEHGFAHYLVEPIDPIQVQVLLKKLKAPGEFVGSAWPNDTTLPVPGEG